jgi:uracil-DNA glycosylase
MHTKREFAVNRSKENRAMTKRAAARQRSAAEFVPPNATLSALREAAATCTGCDLYKHATQTVFGEGRQRAQLVLIGEQPGDQEDRTGKPFVGPAGRLLDRALAEAGIARDKAYVTNAVKHFKWTARGKRRLHQKPREGEIDACNPWLQAELTVLKPRVVVCLGATAARAVYGKAMRLKDYRGQLHASPLASRTLFTIHPAAILRLREPAREIAYQRLVADFASLRVLID